MNTYDVSVVTITYNEAENIGRFLSEVSEALQRSGLCGQIIVVDDNSPDRTAEIVRARIDNNSNPAIMLVSRPGKLGIGSAYLEGARRSTGECMVLMDADLSHPPEVLPNMVRAAQAGAIAAGSRFIENSDFGTAPWRKAATTLLNRVASSMLKLPLQDYTNGYVALKRRDLEGILKAGTEAGVHPFDHILYGVALFSIASHLGISITEIRASYRFRNHGESKIGLLAGIKLFYETMRLITQCKQFIAK